MQLLLPFLQEEALIVTPEAFNSFNLFILQQRNPFSLTCSLSSFEIFFCAWVKGNQGFLSTVPHTTAPAPSKNMTLRASTVHDLCSSWAYTSFNITLAPLGEKMLLINLKVADQVSSLALSCSMPREKFMEVAAAVWNVIPWQLSLARRCFIILSDPTFMSKFCLSSFVTVLKASLTSQCRMKNSL